MDYRIAFIDSTKVGLYEEDYIVGKYHFYEWELEKSTITRLFRRHFNRNGKAAKYLDFACGTGRVIHFMKSFAEKSIGIDISQSMVDIARAKCPGIDFIVTDATAEKDRLKQLGPFDLITVFRFLAPAEENLRVASLGILADCLSTNGIMIINNNANRTSLLYPTLMLRSLFGRPFKSSANYIQSLPYKHLCRLLNSVGLDIVESVGVCFLPSIIARRLPKFLWYPVEKTLSRVNLFAPIAVNQIMIVKKHSNEEIH